MKSEGDLELAAWEACGGRATRDFSWWHFPNGSRMLITGEIPYRAEILAMMGGPSAPCIDERYEACGGPRGRPGIVSIGELWGLLYRQSIARSDLLRSTPWPDGDWAPGPVRGVDDWSESPF